MFKWDYDCGFAYYVIHYVNGKFRVICVIRTLFWRVKKKFLRRRGAGVGGTGVGGAGVVLLCYSTLEWFSFFSCYSRNWKQFMWKMPLPTTNSRKSSSNSTTIIHYPKRTCHGNEWSKITETIILMKRLIWDHTRLKPNAHPYTLNKDMYYW